LRFLQSARMPTPTITPVVYRHEPTADRGVLSGTTILIVEDEPLVALDLHSALRAAGAGLIAATSRSEALTIIRRNDVAAAILDVALAGEDCRAVCQALFHRSVPFLFYTGHRDAAVLTEWPEAPVLEKPKSHDEVVAAIARLCR
jgi:DNA-binding response OmpR family regulator